MTWPKSLSGPSRGCVFLPSDRCGIGDAEAGKESALRDEVRFDEEGAGKPIMIALTR
jgi:hypothetical protein